jgi:pimeloyl-ACP methyl ester carboxylesterase
VPFSVRTLDRVRIAGVELSGTKGASDVAVVLCHGFLGTWRREQNVALARALADHHAVYLFDFRGHGASGGESTVGDREALDVQAVAGFARQRGHGKVVTIGASMGAISVLREAARFHDVDGVVSISSPGRWSGHGRVANLAGMLVSTRAGRSLARRAFKTRVYPEWTWSPPPIEMIEIIEAPVLIVHGTNDRFIPPAQAELLYARAKPPKRLVVLDGFGHAELGYTPVFGERLLKEIDAMLLGNGWGVPGDVEAPLGILTPGIH